VKHVTLIPLDGMEEKAREIKEIMPSISEELEVEIVESKINRFMTGDAKAVLEQSIRGREVFILVDVGNYECEYKMYDRCNSLSPDEHFQNLVRTISAIGGKAEQVRVIMPMLYSARQDRRTTRESLDCAVALQNLERIGVKGIMSIDVHDDRVQNAVPFMEFDNLVPTYQVIKALCKSFPDIVFDEDHTIMISPDFGAMNRNYLYAKELGIDLGVFYKKRNLFKVTNGQTEILVHKYLGPDLTGKDVIMIDDIIASGETILDSVKEIKSRGAKRVFVGVSFALFTKGTEIFSEAYAQGILDGVFITNASYVNSNVKNTPWYHEVDITKYISNYIYCVSVGVAVSKIMDPHVKIEAFLKKRLSASGDQLENE